MKPTISVIMLTYNRENLVSRAIETIMSQTFANFEFIIVNNGSTDRSGAIADEYAKNDPRIRVIHRSKGNIGSGRNTGLTAAIGEYIAFIDDDDWCEPDYLEFLYNNAVDNNAEISICGAYRNENNRITTIGIAELVIMNAEYAIIELMWRKRYNNGFPTKLIRKKIFTDLSFPEIGRYDDIYLMYKVLAKANRISSYGLPKYRVYRHAGNNSTATTNDEIVTPEYINDYLKVYLERSKWLCDKFPNSSAYWKYFSWSFQISMVNKIILRNLDCTELLKHMLAELNVYWNEFMESPYVLDFEKEWMMQYVRNTKVFTVNNDPLQLTMPPVL